MFGALKHECEKHASEQRQNKQVSSGVNGGEGQHNLCLRIVGR